jgi:hypothetical protein
MTSHSPMPIRSVMVAPLDHGHHSPYSTTPPAFPASSSCPVRKPPARSQSERSPGGAVSIVCAF